MKCTDPNFIPKLRSLMGDLSKHILEEERDDLPRLDNALTSRESESLSRQFERTKMFVPTRSHPSAPARPPFETVVGLMAAPIDKLGDIFRKFPS